MGRLEVTHASVQAKLPSFDPPSKNWKLDNVASNFKAWGYTLCVTRSTPRGRSLSLVWLEHYSFVCVGKSASAFFK